MLIQILLSWWSWWFMNGQILLEIGIFKKNFTLVQKTMWVAYAVAIPLALTSPFWINPDYVLVFTWYLEKETNYFLVSGVNHKFNSIMVFPFLMTGLKIIFLSNSSKLDPRESLLFVFWEKFSSYFKDPHMRWWLPYLLDRGMCIPGTWNYCSCVVTNWKEELRFIGKNPNSKNKN